MKDNILCLLILIGLFTSIDLNAEVKVEFVDPKKFTDYRLSKNTLGGSLEILQKEFDVIFEKLSAEYLPKDSYVFVKIFDVDLAGEENQKLRRITGDIRRVELKFQLFVFDANKKLLLSESHYLRDVSRRPKIRKTFDDWKPTDLFRKPLKNWFATLRISQK